MYVRKGKPASLNLVVVTTNKLCLELFIKLVPKENKLSTKKLEFLKKQNLLVSRGENRKHCDRSNKKNATTVHAIYRMQVWHIHYIAEISAC